jgi:hypothetical protein
VRVNVVLISMMHMNVSSSNFMTVNDAHVFVVEIGFFQMSCDHHPQQSVIEMVRQPMSCSSGSLILRSSLRDKRSQLCLGCMRYWSRAKSELVDPSIVSETRCSISAQRTIAVQCMYFCRSSTTRSIGESC